MCLAYLMGLLWRFQRDINGLIVQDKRCLGAGIDMHGIHGGSESCGIYIPFLRLFTYGNLCEFRESSDIDGNRMASEICKGLEKS